MPRKFALLGLKPTRIQPCGGSFIFIFIWRIVWIHLQEMCKHVVDRSQGQLVVSLL
ncbi:unnamed protein product [Lactuca virosa]|uniref:Uncharacterized protein n=1 Tax=Lactuca virosa TaxID=75947 RepID=A0AAU9N559_9ASTR|nr:unnamed protein product [Lactuca virosa]